MITLCIIRHAKSNNHHPSLQDIERLLNSQGEQEATTLGKFLHGKGFKPDLIITSPAKRAVKTSQLIAEAMSYPIEKLKVNEHIYEASVEELLHLIERFDKDNKMIFLIGHNPALSMLANYFANDNMINLAPCGVCCIDFKTDDWQEITTAEGVTRFIT